MSAGGLRQRPIYGGVFGVGQYALATTPCISNGLHAVKFMVIEPRAGTVLSVADSKLDALAAARRVLRAANMVADEAANDPQWEQTLLWDPEAIPPSIASPPKRVSGKRRAVFERSDGRCHYCRAALTLDGTWHVEHQLPRALGGQEGVGNLVAACAPCNLSKGDRTALEFVARSPGGL